MLDIWERMTWEEQEMMRLDCECLEMMDELVEIGREHGLYQRLEEIVEAPEDERSEQGSGDAASVESEETTTMTHRPRVNLCHGCGCGDPRCSSCWLSDDELE